MRTQLSLFLDSADGHTDGGRRKVHRVCPLHNLRETLLHPDVIVRPRPLHLGFHILTSKVAPNVPFLNCLSTNFVDFYNHALCQKSIEVLAKLVHRAPGKGMHVLLSNSQAGSARYFP